MDFHAPLDDILFSLKVAGADDLEQWDEEITRDIASHFSSFAENVLGPINATGDQEGARFLNGRVVMPKGFVDAYQQLSHDGWQGLTASEEFGGQGLDSVTLAVVSEVFSGANHALQMITGLVPGAIRTLERFGTQEQRVRLIPRLATGELLATMCLTEADAGSDLSRIRCRAVQNNGRWEISGEKIFISGGDQDLSDDILNLVLARTSNDGINGLSLFAVQGRVKVTRIEQKMGIHASPTCQLEFQNTQAELIGEEGGGLAAMFTMMNHARIDVALQGAAHASHAHELASRYAAERVQGNLNGKPLTIAEHADVRRMLTQMDALALTARGLAHLALIAVEKSQNELVEFLTPLAKIYATQAGIQSADIGIQVLGGYGYLHEYGIEQIYRDARITAIYEGTNGIHARSLATRAMKTGAASAFEEFLSEKLGSDPLFQQWKRARIYMTETDRATAQAWNFAQISGILVASLFMQNMNHIASQHPQSDRIERASSFFLYNSRFEIPMLVGKITGHYCDLD